MNKKRLIIISIIIILTIIITFIFWPRNELFSPIDALKTENSSLSNKTIKELNNNYYQELKKSICENHLEGYVILAGFTENMEKVWRNTDICVMCSRAEAFGRVTVEAMLAGVFVIGANTAGTAEIIEDQKNGLLYQQGDPKDLASKIMYVLQHKEWAKRIAMAGQQYALEKFSALRNAEEIVGVYQAVLQEHTCKNQKEEKQLHF